MTFDELMDEFVLFSLQERAEPLKTASMRPDTEHGLPVLPYEITDELLRQIHLVDRWASDLLITLDAVRRRIAAGEEKGTAVFGFRRDGVDGPEFLTARFRSWQRSGDISSMHCFYRRILLLSWKPGRPGELELTLSDATGAAPDESAFRKAEEEAEKKAEAPLFCLSVTASGHDA